LRKPQDENGNQAGRDVREAKRRNGGKQGMMPHESAALGFEKTLRKRRPFKIVHKSRDKITYKKKKKKKKKKK